MKTGGTENGSSPEPVSKFAYILDLVRKQTPEETKQILIEAGIITETGELTPHYQHKPKKAKAKRKPTGS